MAYFVGHDARSRGDGLYWGICEHLAHEMLVRRLDEGFSMSRPELPIALPRASKVKFVVS